MKAAPKKNTNILKNILPQLIMDNFNGGIIAIDLEGRISFINRSAIKILAKNLNGTGMDIYKYLPQDKKRFFKNGINKLMEDNSLKQVILKTAFKDKKVKAVFSCLKDDSGEITGTLISLSDITEDAVIDEKKTNFITDVSHALRTPITAIHGAAELILKGVGGRPNKKHEEFSSIITKNCKRLNNLINDVVRIAKHEHQRVSLNLARADLISIVENQIFQIEKKMKEKGVLIEKIFPPASDVMVKMDAEKIEEAVAILLTNAVRYTAKGEKIRISIDIKDGISKSDIELKTYNPDTKRGFIEVGIYNQCKGISEKRLSSLFDKYDKIKNFDVEGNKPDSDGKVLKLPLARLLVESHDGKIWAEAEKGGCIFYFSIPIFKIDSYQEGNRTMTVPMLPHEDQKISIGIDEKHRVLVINDSPVVFKMYSEALEKMGYDILKGANNEDAIDLARKHRPNIIIIDLSMPEINDVSIVKVLREDPETKEMPIIIFSQHSSEGLRLNEGMSVTIAKRPLDQETFANYVNEAMFRSLRRADGKEKILIVDDEQSIASLLSSMLLEFGYRTIIACTGEDALRKAEIEQPQLILLDINLPGMDGFQILERLKNNISTSHIPIILLSGIKDAKEKARGLNLGASDYITKPYSSLELEARIRMLIQRREEEHSASPTTRLPGNIAIEREINAKIRNGNPFSVCYIDLDNFKAYNDNYGFLKGDAVIKQTAKVIADVVKEYGNDLDFIGHIGGDDFIIITTPDKDDIVCSKIIDSFNKIIPLYYNKEDRSRGYIELENRRSQIERFPIMTISIAVVTSNDQRRIKHFAQISDIAAEIKKAAKRIEGSVYIKDRRFSAEAETFYNP